MLPVASPGRGAEGRLPHLAEMTERQGGEPHEDHDERYRQHFGRDEELDHHQSPEDHPVDDRTPAVPHDEIVERHPYERRDGEKGQVQMTITKIYREEGTEPVTETPHEGGRPPGHIPS